MADKELFGISEQLNDTISRAAVLDALADYIHNVDRVYSTWQLTHEDCMDAAHSVLDELPSAQPEITYQVCSDALLMMWMDNVLTDGEYNRIMDKLNMWKEEDDE